MSHIPHRKEKDCLNCGTIVEGPFCHQCGQENVVPKETFWHMVTHFFYDITHFDSKFFDTLRYLVFKPGFLSREYMKGRRVAYLHPINMSVFSSAVFFLPFFSFFSPTIKTTGDLDSPTTDSERKAVLARLQKAWEEDTTNTRLKSFLLMAADTSRDIRGKDYIEFNDQGAFFSVSDIQYDSYAEYDSVQKSKPVSDRDNWIERRFMKTQIELNNSYRRDPDGTVKKLVNSLLHRLPYMLFVSLPLFALILQLVYIRRKQFYYADHGVFTIHLYIFSFLLLLIVFISDAIQNVTMWDFWQYFIFIMILALFFYLYKGMRNFYGQRRAKTFFKFLLVSILSLVMMLALFLIFMIFSALTF